MAHKRVAQKLRVILTSTRVPLCATVLAITSTRAMLVFQITRMSRKRSFSGSFENPLFGMSNRRKRGRVNKALVSEANFRNRLAARPKILTRTGGLLGPTLGFLDQAVSNNTILNLWSSARHDPTGDCIGMPEQGAGVQQRLGNIYTVTGINIRGEIRLVGVANETLFPSTQIIKIILVQDTETQAVAAAGNLVMTPSITPEIDTFRVIENTGRFKILKTKTLTIDPMYVSDPKSASDNYDLGNTIRQFKMNWTPKVPVIVKCKTGTTTGEIANVKDNSFHIYAIRASGLVPSATIGYVSRTRFLP